MMFDIFKRVLMFKLTHKKKYFYVLQFLCLKLFEKLILENLKYPLNKYFRVIIIQVPTVFILPKYSE